MANETPPSPAPNESAPSSAPAPESTPPTNDTPGLSDLFESIERGGDQEVVEQQKQDVAQKLPVKARRTYEDDEEKEIFSNMSNKAYDKLYPEWQKIKKGEYVSKAEIEKLKREMDEAKNRAVQSVRWDDHPKAYQLSDEYEDIADSQALYRDIMEHYQHSLARVEANQPFFRIIPDKEKKYVIDQKQQIPPGPEAKAYIIAQLQQFGGLQAQADAKLEQLKQSSSQQFGQVKEAMERADKEIFGPVAANPHFEAAWKKELEIFPPALRNTLQYQLLAKASVVIRALGERGKKAKQEATANSTQPQGIAGQTAAPDNRKAMLAQLDAMASR
jgi:hypothetical protein